MDSQLVSWMKTNEDKGKRSVRHVMKELKHFQHKNFPLTESTKKKNIRKRGWCERREKKEIGFSSKCQKKVPRNDPNFICIISSLLQEKSKKEVRGSVIWNLSTVHSYMKKISKRNTVERSKGKLN